MARLNLLITGAAVSAALMASAPTGAQVLGGGGALGGASVGDGH